jgi:hypothetical protein
LSEYLRFFTLGFEKYEFKIGLIVKPILVLAFKVWSSVSTLFLDKTEYLNGDKDITLKRINVFSEVLFFDVIFSFIY